MTVLTPALLALGLAAAVPLLLHLLQRNRGPRVVFPALRYLRRAERDHASRIRLRQVLLLALRVAALLLLAAAAARPFLVGAGADHEPTSVVLVLDNSLSSGAVVGDGRVLDELRAGALATLDAAAPGDRFWLIRAGEPWEPAVTGPAPTVRRAVLETRPSAAAADLAGELERAASILAGEPAGRAREIHLLSDLQATGFRGTVEIDAAVRVLVPSPAAVVNRGVVGLEVAGGVIPRAGERVLLSVTVAGSDRPSAPDVGSGGGTAAPDRDSVTLRLVEGGRVRAAARVAAGEGAVLSLSPRAPGVAAGRVELDADALAADDRRYFALRISPPPTVAVAEPVPFLEQALAVLADGGRLRRVGTDADVVIAPGGRGASAVRRGTGAVILPPTSSLELAAANRRLAAAGVPWRYEAPGPGEARVDSAGSRLGRLLADVRLREVYGLTAVGQGDDSVLVRLRDGAPWAVTGSLEGGRYVLLGSPLVPAAGTIPTSAAMIPLLDHIVGGWAPDGQTGAEHAPGDLVATPAGDSLVGPAGAAPAVGAVVRLIEPGIHRLYRDGEVVAAYAVNPPAPESDLTRLAIGPVVERVRSPDVQSAAARDWGRVVFHRRLGHEVTRVAVALALAVLLLETLVAAVGRGARRERPGTPTVPAREAG